MWTFKVEMEGACTYSACQVTLTLPCGELLTQLTLDVESQCPLHLSCPRWTLRSECLLLLQVTTGKDLSDVQTSALTLIILP